MKISPLGIVDILYICPERITDQRGFFSRTFCVDELSKVNVSFSPNQVNLSFNEKIGTLRGMHFQIHPHEEAKIVQCLEGSMFDVAVDLRPQSPTYQKWVGQVLNVSRNDMLYIPPGFAHGFLTLEPNTLIQYFMSAPYVAEAADGIRYDDPKIGIEWPDKPQVMSDKDLLWPLL